MFAQLIEDVLIIGSDEPNLLNSKVQQIVVSR
ncbi:hypothetical protein SAMN06269250_0984 [Spirosoma fluviale]|uniref:Uncharacterized protein n=1 Tax=Spirosoma fluviale TaxID=1597977 RepID=A0A286F8J7_9BACT|nr:hypothetical protein SAMN06269250_0984 [Spirosoma fluviale]